jgi:hypothetical protein
MVIMAESVIESIFDACAQDKTEVVKQLLADHPEFDHNTVHRGGTLLHFACCSHEMSEIIKLLLARPSIDVNVKTTFNNTPLAIACCNGNTRAVKILLEDERTFTTVNEPDISIALRQAIANCRDEVLELFIATKRDIPPLVMKMADQGDRLNSSRRLLYNFKVSPEETRQRVQLKWKMITPVIASLFALVIFFCDDLLQIKTKKEEAEPPTVYALTQPFMQFQTFSLDVTRFFNVVQSLPMELQMIICNMVYGSPKEYIATKDSEPAFKTLAKILSPSLV